MTDAQRPSVLFRQLFEPISSTYTYLLGCEETGQALLIDPVLPTWERDLEIIRALGLRLRYTVETHIHADHITSARQLKQAVGSLIAGPALDRLACTDALLEEGKPLQLGSIRLDPLHTPGHTDNHFSYRLGDRLFSGDALLIDGCGRTDFQSGDAATLYRSITQKLFSLPDETLVYPAHDYEGRRVSSIGQEKVRNARLGGGKSMADFVRIMDELKLDYPKFIDHALPGNRACGACPPDVPAQLQEYCAEVGKSRQG